MSWMCLPVVRREVTILCRAERDWSSSLIPLFLAEVDFFLFVSSHMTQGRKDCFEDTNLATYPCSRERGMSGTHTPET